MTFKTVQTIFILCLCFCCRPLMAETNGIIFHYLNGTSQVIPFADATEITFSESDVCVGAKRFPLTEIKRYEFCDVSQFVGIPEIISEVLTIDSDGHIEFPADADLSNLRIYDAKGQLCVFTLDDRRIDCSSLNPGVYILSYGKNEAIKFVKN